MKQQTLALTPWGGGGCPVNRSDLVAVQFRDLECSIGKAWKYQWEHTHAPGDVVAYTLLQVTSAVSQEDEIRPYTVELRIEVEGTSPEVAAEQAMHRLNDDDFHITDLFVHEDFADRKTHSVILTEGGWEVELDVNEVLGDLTLSDENVLRPYVVLYRTPELLIEKATYSFSCEARSVGHAIRQCKDACPIDVDVVWVEQMDDVDIACVAYYSDLATPRVP
jgi:hypothetical protein